MHPACLGRERSAAGEAGTGGGWGVGEHTSQAAGVCGGYGKVEVWDGRVQRGVCEYF